ncbi:stage II sporulation protein D [Dysosmobacter sp.]|uniref:stage II sporulation protein D n=1 Tax=Dysosmobacter sp. TaxID=2591382 RepID=UPI002A8FC0C5|nr:stage II sporulation protein D [Dysosmobacter sp.]MDY3282320.1 stage II sporulation protein D [Dysosmobacter sp.]
MKRKRRRKGSARGACCVGVSLALAGLLFLLPLFSGERRETAGEQEPEPIQILPPGETDSGETIRVLLGEEVREMTMGEYLAGVVRAEMPAAFAQEALCAQAVAARTYTRYQLAGGSRHADTADICGDHTCCQAFLDKETAAENWGADAERYEAKVENAVAATDGQVILYDGQPILAVFHSSSAGQTKSAGTVWTEDLPYLRSVSSPEGEEVPNYYSRVELSAAEFREKFLAACPEADLSGGESQWVGEVKRTEGSNVESITIGGVAVKGSRVRTVFGLRSASFDLEVGGGKAVFYVTGYGHGVGMSQYGANALAKEGKTWREILLHYYTGVTIGPYPAG